VSELFKQHEQLGQHLSGSFGLHGLEHQKASQLLLGKIKRLEHEVLC
jgi:hypothetical protein